MRYIYITLFILSALYTSAQNEIKLNSILPSQINSGESYTVQLFIDKPDIRYYAVFSQKFPKGFTVDERYSAGAEFKFTNQELSYVWIRLPKQKRITLTYKVNTDVAAKGLYKFSGSLKYLAGNRTGNVFLDTVSIVIGSNQSSTQTISENSTSSENNMQSNELKELTCKRTKILFDKKNKTYYVTIEIVKKAGKISTTRITEVIPAGYKASLLSSRGANFNISNNQLVYLWSNIPDDNKFTVSYMLKSENNIKTKPEIKGYIEYIKEGIIIKEDIVN